MFRDLKLQEAASEIPNRCTFHWKIRPLLRFHTFSILLQVVLNHLNLETDASRGKRLSKVSGRWEPDTQGAEQNQHGIYTTDAHQLQPAVELLSTAQVDVDIIGMICIQYMYIYIIHNIIYIYIYMCI